MNFIGHFEDIDNGKYGKELSCQDIEWYTRQIVEHRDGFDVNSTVIYESIRGIWVRMKISDLEASVFHFDN